MSAVEPSLSSVGAELELRTSCGLRAEEALSLQTDVKSPNDANGFIAVDVPLLFEFIVFAAV
jgi:hypothetical protein